MLHDGGFKAHRRLGAELGVSGLGKKGNDDNNKTDDT